MRIVIISRIFTPEPAAAAFILRATAEAFTRAGHDVEVVTTAVPETTSGTDPEGVRVSRWPVLRDARGYVRGYASYLSFDIPVFFRLLFSRRADVYLVEPPPTTGAVVRLVSLLRRTPYVYDAADLWSDAARVVTSSSLVLAALRKVERFAMNGASHAFAISQGLVDRMREIGIVTPATAVGFGTDVSAFRYYAQEPPTAPHFVYGGSYSEWHGAEVFVEAFAIVQKEHPGARLTFVGNGAEKPRLRRRVTELGLSGVEFLEPISPEALSAMLSEATASLASLRPNAGYDYAFTTKIYASLVSGCPVVFAGTGPTGPFLRAESAQRPVGAAVDWDADAAASAMLAAAAAPLSASSREALADWAGARFSLSAVADRIVAGTEAVVSSGG